MTPGFPIAAEQIRASVAAGVTRGVVLADAAYGNDGEFRCVLHELGLQYFCGCAKFDDGLGAWETAFASQATKKDGTTSAAIATL